MATKLVRDLRNALRPFAGRTTATDLARDLAEAFRLEFPPVDPDTKYANALARGIPALRKLLRAEGGSLSELEVQAKLGVSQAVLLKLVKKRQIVAWHQGEALRFPVWQFGAGVGYCPEWLRHYRFCRQTRMGLYCFSLASLGI